ncbi:protein unc-13 homolog C-like [Nematostella vectensis]|uniref:protein unc-13 homolog C-like n=1 Tax=Nematostella vectensis TaxID=45351 RepID=UPI0020771350|nr:protein unc-13 homolog C-like [Nematostella vectensis]
MHVDETISELKISVESAHEKTETVEKTQLTQEKALIDLGTQMNNTSALIKDLKNELVDLKAQSMWNNLIFYNVNECAEEDPFAVVQKVLVTNFKFKDEEVKADEIGQAHRLGRRDPNKDKPRPLIARFLRFQDKESIPRLAYRLKGTNIAVAEQFPKEIAARRKELYPIMKTAKNKGHEAIMDQLIINGQVYRG